MTHIDRMSTHKVKNPDAEHQTISLVLDVRLAFSGPMEEENCRVAKEILTSTADKIRELLSTARNDVTRVLEVEASDVRY